MILADDLSPELVTIASRCVRVDFGPVPPRWWWPGWWPRASSPLAAQAAAEASAGDLDRARLLAADLELVARRHAWATVPRRLDGTGAVAAAAVDELLALIASVASPLMVRQPPSWRPWSSG